MRKLNLAGKKSPKLQLPSFLTAVSEITDNRYLHAFRVFRDVDSGCVRFEATARRGPLKTIPIWTAFVTQYIGRTSWMKRVGSATIQFGEIRPYVFCDGYRLPRGSSGKYQLTFTTSEGKSSHHSYSWHHTEQDDRRQSIQRHVPSHQGATLIDLPCYLIFSRISLTSQQHPWTGRR